MNISDYLEEVPCNLCGKSDYMVMYRPNTSDYQPEEVFSASGGVRGNQQIVKCKYCGW